MWVIDIRHWLDEETQSAAAVPQLKNKVEKLGEMIAFATSEFAGIPVGHPPACWRRPGRKPCKGVLDVYLDIEDERIYWSCNRCEDEGIISGWQGSIWDMTNAPAQFQ